MPLYRATEIRAAMVKKEDEDFGVKLLMDALPYLAQYGCNKTHHLVTDFLSDWRKGRKNMPRLPVIVECYVNEVAEKYPDQASGVLRIEELIQRHAVPLLSSDSEWIIENDDWSEEDYRKLVKTAETIFTKIKETDDAQIKIVLNGMALIIQYEIFTISSNRLMDSMFDIAVGRPDKKGEQERRKKIREEIYCVERMVEGRSDVCRMRDAYAHAHFYLNGDGTITLWDELHGQEVFSATYTCEELYRINKSFNEKIFFIQVFQHLLLAMGHIRKGHNG